MQPQMSARANQSPRRLPFGLPTARVCPTALRTSKNEGVQADALYSDANLFKEAFIKAQQENEALFPKESTEEVTE